MTIAAIEAIEARIKDITAALEQSLANHNGLLGRLSEAKDLLAIMQKTAETVAPIAEAVAHAIPEAAPIATEVADVAGEVASLV